MSTTGRIWESIAFRVLYMCKSKLWYRNLFFEGEGWVVLPGQFSTPDKESNCKCSVEGTSVIATVTSWCL